MTNRIYLILLIFPLMWPSFTQAASEFEQAVESYRNNNYAVALPAFTKLAEQGDARAQTVLALMHKYGEGTQENPLLAFKWYQRAAKLNYPPAQFNLGLMHQEGLGTAINYALAIEWYTKAALGGFERANDKLVELNSAVVPRTVMVDPEIPGPEAWNFRLPNSHRRAPQEEIELNDTIAQNQLSSPSNSYQVQLGAMSSIKAAEALWHQIVFLSPELFANQKMFIKPSKKAPNPIYLLQIGPFIDFSEATSFCQKMNQRGIRTGCLPLSSTDE